MQIQTLLAVGGGGARSTERGTTGSNIGSQMEMAKPAIFNGEAGRVGGFVITCRLYLRMKMREATVEEQVQWVLSYVQEGSADVWKENVMEELETGEMEYETGRIFDKFKEGIQWRRRGVGESGGVKKAGARREDDGGVCTRIQESSKRKQV